MARMQVGIGQDSHRFLPSDSTKPCIIGGVHFEDEPGLHANSDGDVVYHAICNAISSISHVLILGGIADDLCLKDWITDSSVYLEEAVKTLKDKTICHVAVTIEGKRPRFKPHLLEMRKNVAKILKIDVTQVGITATTGEGLTNFGMGDGIQAIAIVTVEAYAE